MTPSAAPARTDLGSRDNALAVLVLLLAMAAFALRFWMSPELMNRVVDYTGEHGAFYEKLHFGTYTILLLLPFVLISRPIYLAGRDITRMAVLVFFCMAIAGYIGLLFITGRASSSGFLIDTYLVAGAAALVVIAMSPDMRRLLGDSVLMGCLLSAVIGIFEAVTRSRVLPYPLEEEVFRPIGLTDHPLTLGMLSAVAMAFVVLSGWRRWQKLAAVLVLFVGVAAAGARFALLLAILEVVALLLFVPWHGFTARNERIAKFFVLMLTVIAGICLLAVLAAGGLLARFTGGLVDENTFARIDIYRIFEFTSWRDVIFGTDLNRILEIVNDKLGLPYIESTPVYLIYQLGAPLALLFALIVFFTFSRLLRGAELAATIGTLVFFVAALSNNTLSSKTPLVAMVMVLILAYAPSGSRRPRGSSPGTVDRLEPARLAERVDASPRPAGS